MHDLCLLTLYCFQVDSGQLITMICHDITSSDYKATMFWLKSSLLNAPKSTVWMILTKIDLLETHAVEEAKRNFSAGLSLLIDQEIITVKYRLQGCSTEYRETYEMHIAKYEDVKMQIQQTEESASPLFTVSCMARWENSVQFISNRLITFKEENHNRIVLRPVDKELFMAIGKLGIKRQMVLSTTTGIMKDPTVGAELQGTVPKGMEELSAITSKESLIPSIETKLQQKFLRFKEVMLEYEPIYNRCYPDDVGIGEEALRLEGKQSLSNLKNNGLLRYFADDLTDNDIIYNDVNTLVSILICIFNHENKEHLTYEKEKCRKYYITERKFKIDCDNLAKFGTLTMTLLSYLLEKSNCEVPREDVIKLLTSLGVGFVVPEEAKKNEVLMFVPFFLDMAPPKDIDKYLAKVMECGERRLSLQTVIKADAPQLFFHLLTVKLYEKLQKRFAFQSSIRAWGSGIFASLGRHKGLLLMKRTNDYTIDFTISTEVSEGEKRFCLDEGEVRVGVNYFSCPIRHS